MALVISYEIIPPTGWLITFEDGFVNIQSCLVILSFVSDAAKSIPINILDNPCDFVSTSYFQSL